MGEKADKEELLYQKIKGLKFTTYSGACTEWIHLVFTPGASQLLLGWKLLSCRQNDVYHIVMSQCGIEWTERECWQLNQDFWEHKITQERLSEYCQYRSLEGMCAYLKLEKPAVKFCRQLRSEYQSDPESGPEVTQLYSYLTNQSALLQDPSDGMAEDANGGLFGGLTLSGGDDLGLTLTGAGQNLLPHGN